MATIEYGPERLKIEKMRADLGVQEIYIRQVLDKVGDYDVEIAETGQKKGAASAKLKSDLMKRLADYQTAKARGSIPAMIKARVEIMKLIQNTPINLAKAANTPDEMFLRGINQKYPLTGGNTDTQYKNEAWQMFYQNIVPSAGNLFGTYKAMEDKYGPSPVMTPDNSALWRVYEDVKGRLVTEEAAAAEAQERYTWLLDEPKAFENFVGKTGAQLGPDGTYDEKVYEAFLNDHYGMKDKLPTLDDTPFMRSLETAIKNDAFADDESLKPYDEAIAHLKSAKTDMLARLPQPGEEAQAEDTFRDKMAAWLQRDDVQWWGKERGFKLGESYPLTDELKAEVEAGKYPGAVYTKYGVYIPAPDDMRAFRAARRDLNRRPEEGFFRAMGLGQGGNRFVEAKLRSTPDPTRIVSVGITKGPDGAPRQIARRGNGQWVVSDDGETWAPVPDEEGAKLAEGVEMGEPTEDPEGGAPAEAQTVRGARRKPVYGRDAKDSLRLVDEDGKEVYYTSDQLEGWQYADEPRKKVVPNEALRKGAFNRAERRAEENPAPAPAVPEPVPPKNDAVATDTTLVREGDAPVKAQRTQDTPMVFPLEDVAGKGTTVPTTTTPTAKTDPRRDMFRKARMSPAATVYAPPAE